MKTYETDFTRWTFEQAAALRAGRVTEAELEHIAEVLEEVGNSEKRAVVSQLARLLAHLLKWEYQPARRGASWRVTIEAAREALEHDASIGMLARHAHESLDYAYRQGRAIAIRETEGAVDPGAFPETCPWTYFDVIDPAFWPSR